MSVQAEPCRRCGVLIYDFCGQWIDVETEHETCGDGEHEPTSTEAERIGFTGYTGCPASTCPATATCMAAGDCYAAYRNEVG